jgi:hypothetical protein
LLPDCSAWSFSITKAYSASVRAGFIIYKKEPATNLAAMVDVMNIVFSMTNGLYSEWSWYGQMQLWEMIMSKPMDDPTSWIGAYGEIMKEKWDFIIDGFADCPVISLDNPYAGAYGWFRIKDPYVGLQRDEFVASFFRDVLGIMSPTYNWGFRGTDPADFYGPGYTTFDFARLQLYRDVSVYEEVGRRAKIVCSDMDAKIGDFLSVNQWVAAASTTTRRLSDGYENLEERKLHLKEVSPDLSDRQLGRLARLHDHADELNRSAKSCAPEYTTSCFFNKIGTRFSDY